MKLYKIKFKFNQFQSEKFISCERIYITDLDPTYYSELLFFGYCAVCKKGLTVQELVNSITDLYINVEHKFFDENFVSLWLRCFSDYNRIQKLNQINEII
jgi:hypothetical protein